MSRFEAVPGKAILHGSDGFGREVLGDDPHRRTRPTEKNARTRHANAERVSKARHILVGGGSEGCVEPMKMRNHDVEHELLRKPPLRRRVPFRLGIWHFVRRNACNRDRFEHNFSAGPEQQHNRIAFVAMALHRHAPA